MCFTSAVGSEYSGSAPLGSVNLRLWCLRLTVYHFHVHNSYYSTYAKVNTVFHSMAPLNPFIFHLQVMQQQRSTKRSASTHPTPMSKEDLSEIKHPESKHIVVLNREASEIRLITGYSLGQTTF